MSTLTHSQRVGLDAFLRAISDGAEAGYPDSVRIVTSDGMTLERLSELLEDSVRRDVPIVIVRNDGAEMLLAPTPRHGIPGLVDRVRRRVRVTVRTRGDRDPVECQTIHPDSVHDLRGLRGCLV